MVELWAFLGDPHNQLILNWLGSGFVVLAGGVWAVLKLFVRPKGEGGGALPSGRVTVQTDHGGIAAAGNVSVRTSRGLSGLQAVLLVGILLGAMLLAGGLLGKRITATQGSVAIGGDVQDSPITIDARGTEP